jgi:hypothetical protein
MSVPNSMWSCAISTVVYLRNRMFSRAVGASGGVPLTLLTSQEPNASKVPGKLRRKLGEKRFAASWMVTHLTPRGIASATLLHAGLPRWCVLRSRKTFLAFSLP